MTLESTFETNVGMQVEAFCRGFKQVMPIEFLYHLGERNLEMLLCGESDNDSQWTDAKYLEEVINTAHGYTK